MRRGASMRQPSTSQPACSTGRVAGQPADLAAANLLHDEDMANWREWFRKAGIYPLPDLKGPVFQDFNLLATSVISGHGVALCPVEVFSREISAGDAELCFYYDTECEHVPYTRGFILAFYFDCAIRKKTNNERNLHDFMLELLEYFQNSGRTVDEHFDFFTETLGEYLGEDPSDFLQQHALKGKRIPPENFLLPDYLQMTVNAKGVPKFSLKAGASEADFLK